MRPLLLVTAAHDIASHEDTGVAGNKPEVRKRLIVNLLQSRMPVEYVAAAERSLALAEQVQDAAMLRFFETAWTRFAKERAKKPNAHLDCFTLGNDETFVSAFHAPRMDGVQAPTRGVLGQACFYGCDRETPITPHTLPALLWDLAVTRRAADAVLQGEARVAYALITHPGHHAGPSCFGGFCYVNHAALAARLLQRRFARVAVVDVDYHAGNGTMAIFYDDASVFFASLHADPEFEYPFNAGFASQIGGPKALGTTFNIPLAGGTDWWGYKAALERVVKAVRDFGAQALVVSLGLDTMRGDPVAFPASRFSLVPGDCGGMGALLLNGLALPTVVVQEGGYELSLVPDAVANFFAPVVEASRM